MADPVPSMSWKPVYRVVCFTLVGLVIVDGLVALLWPIWDRYNSEVYSLRIRAAQQQSWDLLAVGGSPVSEGIDVRRMVGGHYRGVPVCQAFNAGLPGATIAETWLAYRHACVTPPRVLLYGITASDVNSRRKEPAGVHLLVDWADLKRWWINCPGDREWAVRHYLQGRVGQLWQLSRRAPQFRLAAGEWAEQVFPGCCPRLAQEARHERVYRESLDGPFAPRPSLKECRLDLALQAKAELPFTYLDRFSLDEKLPYLHAIIDRAARDGSDLYLVDMPVSAELEEVRHPEVFAEYREALARIERERGARVLRASRQAVGLGNEHFSDLIHLNATGAARLADWLRRQLEEYPAPPRGPAS